MISKTPLLPEDCSPPTNGGVRRGLVPNGRGGRKRMVRPILLYNIRIGVAKAAYFSYHLPLRGLTPSLLPRLSGESNLPEGGEFSNHCQLLIVNCAQRAHKFPFIFHHNSLITNKMW